MTILYLRDFCAKDDGKTDNTTATQAAINATKAAGGDSHASAGTYIVTSHKESSNGTDIGTTGFTRNNWSNEPTHPIQHALFSLSAEYIAWPRTVYFLKTLTY